MHKIAVFICIVLALAGTSGSTMAAADDSNNALRSFLAEASKAQSMGDFRTAAESYRKAVAIDPNIPELWANLGLMYHESGQSAEAIKSFAEAIRLKPSLFVPQLFSGTEYLSIGHPEIARGFLENAVRLNPKDVQAQRGLGEDYAELGLGTRAIDADLKAIELKPNDGSLWVDVGMAYLEQVQDDARMMSSTYAHSAYSDMRAAEIFAEEGKLVQAASAWKAVIASPGSPPCAHAGFGIILLRRQMIPEAREQFRLETATNSHCGLARLGSAVADLAEGHTNAGLTELDAMVTADHRFVHFNLPLFRGAMKADQVKSIGDIRHAQSGFTDLQLETAALVQNAFLSDDSRETIAFAEERPSIGTHQSGAANIKRLYESGQYYACDQALKSSLPTIRTAEGQILAACSFYAGDFETTSRAAERLKSNPGTIIQGLYWESKADEELAVGALTHARQIDPNSARMHILTGDMFRQKRRWSDAEAEYRKAIALDPKGRTARLNLAIILFTELQTDEALALDKSLLDERPGDPEANLLAGEIFVQQNKFSQAEPYLIRCKDLKTELVPRLHALRGRVYAETGRTEDAIAEYKLALRADADGSLHYQIGRLYQKIGNRASAEEAFRDSQRLMAHDNDLARIGLEEEPTDKSRQ